MPYHHPAVMHSLDNPPEKKYIDGIQKKEIKLKLEIEKETNIEKREREIIKDRKVQSKNDIDRDRKREKEREGDDAKKHKKNVEKNVEMCLLKKVKYLL